MKFGIAYFTITLLMAIPSFAQNGESTQSAIRRPDTPVKILFRPKAEYPKSDGGSVCIRGTVTLKVQFLESGKIGDIVAVTRLPYGATENAIEAAKKMRFKPATRDGKPVTKSMTVQFWFAED